MSKPYLISLIGHSGSGKSYFARALAEQNGWVRLNGDTLRIAMFGSREGAQKAKEVDPSLVREKVFNALDYATGQILKTGISVVYDANNNKRSIRDDQAILAHKYGAIPLAVWVKTPRDVAIERTQSREELIDQRKMDAQQAQEVVDRHIQNFDEPGDDELVITIDGLATSAQQLEQFTSQLKEITHE